MTFENGTEFRFIDASPHDALEMASEVAESGTTHITFER